MLTCKYKEAHVFTAIYYYIRQGTKRFIEPFCLKEPFFPMSSPTPKCLTDYNLEVCFCARSEDLVSAAATRLWPQHLNLLHSVRRLLRLLQMCQKCIWRRWWWRNCGEVVGRVNVVHQAFSHRIWVKISPKTPFVKCQNCLKKSRSICGPFLGIIMSSYSTYVYVYVWLYKLPQQKHQLYTYPSSL